MAEIPKNPEAQRLPTIQELKQRGFVKKNASQRTYMVLEAEDTLRVGVGPRITGGKSLRDSYPVQEKDDARNVQQPPALRDAYEIREKEIVKQITGEELTTLAIRLAFPGRFFSQKSAKDMLPPKREEPPPLPIKKKIGTGRKKNPMPKETYLLMGFAEISVGGKTYLYRMDGDKFVILVKVEGAVKWRGEAKDDYDMVDEVKDSEVYQAVRNAIHQQTEKIPKPKAEAQLKAEGFIRRELGGLIYMVKIGEAMTIHTKRASTGGEIGKLLSDSAKGALSTRRQRKPQNGGCLEEAYILNVSTGVFTEITDRQALGTLENKLKLITTGGDAD